MTQTWKTLTTLDDLGDIVQTHLPARTESLRSLHSGPTEPPSPVAYMLWADTTDGVLKIRNAANSAWITVANLGSPWSRTPFLVYTAASVSATVQLYCPVPWFDCELARAVIVCASTTSGSDVSNNWSLQIENATQGLADLHPTGVSTVGNEIAAFTAWEFVPDQNNEIATNDLLLATFTKTGSPTSPLLGFQFQIEFQPRQ